MSKAVAGGVMETGLDDGLCFDQLEVGSSMSIVVMVCRSWDSDNVHGRYISTDYIFSDRNGDSIHATARSNVAHYFVDKLKEGCLYLLKNFTVVKNRPAYRILKDSQYMIELHGSTVFKKVSVDHGGFERYPFQIVQFEDLEVTNNKYFVDVIGYVTTADNVSTTSTGRRMLEFNLRNERGRHMAVTLWGKLSESFIAQKAKKAGVYTVILSSMTVKQYLGSLGLSSSSATLIIDSNNIPLLESFNASLRGVDLRAETQPARDGPHAVTTIAELLQSARQDKKKAVVFRNSIQITGIRTKNSWFNFTCTGGRCRKGVTRKDGSFWCEACDNAVYFPRARYRLMVDVKDMTGNVVVVLFDEAGEQLVKKSAKTLLDEQEQSTNSDDMVLPEALRCLIGGTYLFELRSHTYYQYGEYESFNCAQVLLPGSANIASPSSVDEILDPAAVPALSSPVKKAPQIGVVTPDKRAEKRSSNLDCTGTDSEGVPGKAQHGLSVDVRSGSDVGSEVNVVPEKRLKKVTGGEAHDPVEGTSQLIMDSLSEKEDDVDGKDSGGDSVAGTVGKKSRVLGWVGRSAAMKFDVDLQDSLAHDTVYGSLTTQTQQSLTDEEIVHTYPADKVKKPPVVKKMAAQRNLVRPEESSDVRGGRYCGFKMTQSGTEGDLVSLSCGPNILDADKVKKPPVVKKMAAQRNLVRPEESSDVRGGRYCGFKMTQSGTEGDLVSLSCGPNILDLSFKPQIMEGCHESGITTVLRNDVDNEPPSSSRSRGKRAKAGNTSISSTRKRNNRTRAIHTAASQRHKRPAFTSAGVPVVYESLGSPIYKCSNCKALMWGAEKSKTTDLDGEASFSSCCQDRKVLLPSPLQAPEPLRSLLDYDNRLAAGFREKIRRYNSMFTYTSFGAKIDHSVNEGRGVYTFRVSGQNYHRIGSLLPTQGKQPTYAQLYFHDTQNEVSNRINALSRDDSDHGSIDEAIVSKLVDMFNTYSAVAKTFRMARDWCAADGNRDCRIRLLGRGTENRQYNAPTASEIAVLVTGDFGESDGLRDIVISTNDGNLKRISELNQLYMALQYPILFPYGETGFHEHIRYAFNSGKRSTKRQNVTMREYYCYMIHQREDETSTLLRGGRLFQQYLVDAYTAIEEQRLKWVRNNQKDLRVELYNNLCDAVTRGDTRADAVGQRIVLPSTFTGSPRYMVQNYQDAMALCRTYGNPDLFITFTANPNWPECDNCNLPS
ncbi:hypothetical protein SSX86_029724 [Deinandra increscens subsp. villosa]|uniref:Uncharacterized protein n=1 Tax=Deinandra increscens subsp. villosa TaxID=3103831 RepID=A0AAP0CH03_9ASTR